MTTSVPSVYPIEDLKRRIADLMELAAYVYRTTGNIDGVDMTIKLARELVETRLKPLGNEEKVDWAYINKCDAIIGRVEASVLKVKTAQRNATNARS